MSKLKSTPVSISLIVVGLSSDEICSTLASLVGAVDRINEIIVVDSSFNLHDNPHFSSLSPLLPSLVVYEVPPQGITHAFNFGLSKSSSLYVCFVNSGDTCLQDGFSRSLDILYESRPDVVASSVLIDFGSSKQLWTGLDRGGKLKQIHQQGTIYRKDLHLAFGTYPALFRCAMDTAFFAPVLLKRSSFVIAHNSLPSVLFVTGGFSSIHKAQTLLESLVIRSFSATYPILYIFMGLPSLIFKIFLHRIRRLRYFA